MIIRHIRKTKYYGMGDTVMILKKDREILRKLAGRVREIAELPEMKDRKKRLLHLNELTPDRPVILCFPEGAWTELLPDKVLECEDKLLRSWEWELRSKIYWWENIKDDAAIEPWFNINWSVNSGNFGVEVPTIYGENRGSYVWDAPIKDLTRDLSKLKFREPSVDRNDTFQKVNLANEIFGDLLPARIRGGFWWTMGLTQEVIRLIGLENLMLYMYDDPDNLHRLMAWMRDEHLNYINWFETEGLLTLKNEDDYVGSGGFAYTQELPQKDWKEGQLVRLKDIWGFAESQETVGVSPEMFAEFVLPYQMPLLEKFGLNCYGCCEPVHSRWQYIKNIPNLRRVSVSPWCDQQLITEFMGENYIFSRKPNPSLVCASFDEEVIREDIRNTINIAGSGALEIILKDTHTVQNDPRRITRWVQIALEEANK